MVILGVTKTEGKFINDSPTNNNFEKLVFKLTSKCPFSSNKMLEEAKTLE